MRLGLGHVGEDLDPGNADLRSGVGAGIVVKIG
jgi:hypothetical protein